LDGDFEEKEGQIAHVSQDPSDGRFENLAFLCLKHHDKYDSRTSQSKGYTRNELLAYRDQLYQKVQNWRGNQVVSSGSLRTRIRGLIREINPKVLQLVDDGAPGVHVMISLRHLSVLHVLQSEPGFEQLMNVRPTGSVISGGFGNRIGNAINDLDEGGMLQGFVLEPSDVLRRGE